MKTITVVNAEDAATFTQSPPININGFSGNFIQAAADDAAAAGSLTIQYSSDGIMWSDEGTPITISGTTATSDWLVIRAAFFRVTYSDTGGAGNITVKCNLSYNSNN